MHVHILGISGTFMGGKGTMYEILRLVDAGRLRPVVHVVLPLEDAPRAHEMIERREQFGKLVLEP